MAHLPHKLKVRKRLGRWEVWRYSVILVRSDSWRLAMQSAIGLASYYKRWENDKGEHLGSEPKQKKPSRNG